MNSKYANDSRALKEEIKSNFKIISKSENIDSIINALPYIALILNSERQVLFTNTRLLEILDLETIDNLLGLRIGEILKCKNSTKEPGGCGTSENCSVCGAVNTMLRSIKTNLIAEGECKISSIIDGSPVSFEFKVKTAPINISGHQYYIFSLVDISNEKRRRILEKLFYHDILNRAGNIKSIVEIFGNNIKEEKLHEMSSLLSYASKELLAEINAQRQLNAAENNELSINLSPASSLDIVSSVAEQIKYHEVADGKEVALDKESEDVEIITDELILKRILINMLKNALEASSKKSIIKVGCTKNNNLINIWVHNSSFIPREVQLQIFMRSFSTKGINRGLGTYSIKLFGEKYLHGIVDFETDETKGTKFYIKLPITGPGSD